MYSIPDSFVTRGAFGEDRVALHEAMADRLSELRRMVLPDALAASCGLEGRTADVVYILGSGPSMLELSAQEKGVLKEGLTVAMNRYLLFWEMVGVWPSAVFLSDFFPPAPAVLGRMLELAEEGDRPRPDFLLDHCLRLYFPISQPALFFRRPHSYAADRAWAENLESPLYFHRGSLTCLINLLAILRVAPRIALVGVDLNRPGNFFQSRLHEYPEFEDKRNAAKERDAHLTAQAMGKLGPIQDAFPEIIAHCARLGISLECASENSLLVKEGILPFRRLGD